MAIVHVVPPVGDGLRAGLLARVRVWRQAWQSRPRRLPTVLAPALPALVLLALTVAATADPSPTGMPYVPPAPHVAVTAR
jgi:hypothetical protein